MARYDAEHVTKSRLYLVLGAVLVIAVGAGLRGVLASQLPLWLDESFQWKDSQKDLGQILLWEHNRIHAPGSYLLTKASLSVLGTSELALRLPSLLLGVANLILAFVLGGALGSDLVGLLFAGALAVDPLLVETDAWARMYSLWLFAAFLTSFVVARIQALSQRQQPIPTSVWLALGGSLALAFWAHSLGLYLWMAVGGAFAWDRLAAIRTSRSWKDSWPIIRGLSVSFAVATSVCAPGWIKVLHHAKNRLMGRSEFQPNPESMGALEVLTDFFRTPLYPVLIALAAAGIVLLYRKKPLVGRLMVALIACCGLVLLFAQGGHFIAGRYLYPLAIPLYLGLSRAMVAVAEGLARQGRTVALGFVGLLLVAVFAFRGSQTMQQLTTKVFHEATNRYEGSRLVQFVQRNAASEDRVILIPPLLIHRARFYGLEERWPPLNLATASWRQDFGYDRMQMPSAADRDVWVVLESSYAEPDWKPVTESTLSSLLPRIMARDVSRQEIESLAVKNVLRIRGGTVWGATSADVLRALHDTPEPAMQLRRAGLAAR